MTEATTSAAAGTRTEEEVRESVTAIVTELAPNPEQIEGAGDSRLVEDLGFHSLALLELAFTLEDEFELPPIDETTARKIVTIDAVVDHVTGILRDRGELAS
ncbi:acyl carrier protein [Micromonospora globbae]|jgi:acyl carrier protein|uniref:Acyl carrier protein n=1 Tax=Micromonospora globbae TaxID=1894969 RepID=A0A420EVV3_9ACTN|nr:phosphopantetheine-binding protein [Micromonospora globbae]RKF24861.1 acyl carrier protein [Micromonospora globbae]WTF83654.1 phosphopantetheine-binding protein [Micromonospora globbae]